MYGTRNQGGPSRLWLLIPIIGVLLVVSFVAAFFFYRPPAVESFYPWFGWWFPFPLFFIIPVIFLVFFGFRWFLWGGWGWGGRWYYNHNSDRAMEILKERFARGEITRDQYEQMTKDLESH
jgi:putative membrane protein